MGSSLEMRSLCLVTYKDGVVSITRALPPTTHRIPGCSFFSVSRRRKPRELAPIRAGKPANSEAVLYTNASSGTSIPLAEEEPRSDWNVEVGTPKLPASIVPSAKLSLGDQAFFLLPFIACATSAAFTSLVIAAVPTLFAMGRAANSLAKLADTAREELPSTMAAIRLSGMEISDLTLELSDLSQEIADGVNKSAQAVQAAEAGIKQIGVLARERTVSIIQERANLPVISMKPVVVGAAKKTSQAVGRATRSLMNIISRGQSGSENEEDSGIDRLQV